MLFTKRPATDAFYDLFGQAAANLVRATDLLSELGNPRVDGQTISIGVAEIERDSDEITHEVYRNINSTFFTPFHRGHVYRLASQLDDVMDHVEASGNLLVSHRLTGLPGPLEDARALIEVLRSQARVTAEAVSQLRPTKDIAVFLAEWSTHMAGFWVAYDRLKHEGDQIHRKLLVRLFSGEYDPVTALEMKEVVGEMKAACDAFDQVASTIATIVFKANC